MAGRADTDEASEERLARDTGASLPPWSLWLPETLTDLTAPGSGAIE